VLATPSIRGVVKWAWRCACALVVAGWLWSAWRSAYWEYPRGLIFLTQGRLELWHYASGYSGRWPSILPRVAPHPFAWSWWFQHSVSKSGNTITCVPLWALEALMLVPVVRPWRFRRSQRRMRRGCCPECGYDLRGIDPEMVCPECGAARKKVPAL